MKGISLKEEIQYGMLGSLTIAPLWRRFTFSTITGTIVPTQMPTQMPIGPTQSSATCLGKTYFNYKAIFENYSVWFYYIF